MKKENNFLNIYSLMSVMNYLKKITGLNLSKEFLLLSEGNPPEIESLGAAVSINESKLIIGTMANLDSVKAVYNNLYSTVAESWTKSLVYCPMIKLDAIIDDTNRNGYIK